MIFVYLKLFLRQLKNCLWLLVLWFKRLFSKIFGRNNLNLGNDYQQSQKSFQSIDSDKYFDGDFVVIEKPSLINSNIVDKPTIISSLSTNVVDGGSDGGSSGGKFPNVQSFSQQDAYNYSNFSLSSTLDYQQKQQQSKSNYGNVSTDNKRFTFSQIKDKSNSKEQDEEEDYFQDMVPEFKKPKTIYINKHDIDNDELDTNSPEKISQKFRIQNQQNLSILDDLDESKFTLNPIGTLDDDLDINPMNSNSNNDNNPTTTWEDMADEEDLWKNTEETLHQLRLEKRERRIREHQLKKQLKHNK